MDDLIFRQAAIEACNQQTTDCNPDHFNGHEHFTEFLDDATIGSFGKWQFANGFNVGVMAARIAIKNIDPTHGRWIHTTQPLGWDDVDCVECSVCGEDFVLDEWAMDDFTNIMNFCPNCGADMREEA